jgi:outer membrane protein assembly factor BamB
MDRRISIYDLEYVTVGKMFHVKQSISAIYAVIGVMLILVLGSACGARLAGPEGWSPPLELTDSILLAQVDRGRISGLDISEQSNPMLLWSFPEVQLEDIDDEGGGFLSGLFGGGSSNEFSSDPLYSTPLIVGQDDIYIVSNSGIVRKLSLLNGVTEIPTEVWATELGEKVISTPVLVDGYLYIATDQGLIFKLVANSGEVLQRWSTGTDRIWSRLHVFQNTLVLTDIGKGQMIFLDLFAGEIVSQLNLDGGVPGDGLFINQASYIGTFGSELLKVDLGGPKIDWRVATDGWIVGQPVIDGSNLYAVTTRGAIYSVDVNSGSVLWFRSYLQSNFRARPVIYRDALLLVDRKGLVFALELDTGNKLWKSSTGRDIDANPILIEDKLIILTKDNQLLEIDAQSGSARLLFSTRQGETDE